MSITPLTPATIRKIGSGLGYDLSEEDACAYQEFLGISLDAYDLVDAAEQAGPQPPSGVRSFAFATPEDDPHHAWYVRTSIRGAATGPLAGRSVAVKDSIFVAGIPMMNGASLLEGYTPRVDATVVTRVLAAGAEIVGKTHCEYFCLSGGSHTNATGPTHNPHRHGYSSGGSSSGAAVVIATGEADLSLGADQAGSIRMPASYSGVVGMKPTYGLVPYTGVAPIDPFFDHVGPMTRTVEDNALLLDVIAGEDDFDMRQKGVRKGDFLSEIRAGVAGMRIGVLAEGFAAPNADEAVNRTVRAAARDLERLGAELVQISFPPHLLGPALWTPISVAGLSETVIHGQGFGMARNDWYPVDMMEHLFAARHRRDELPPNIKAFTVLGEWVRSEAGRLHYGKAVNALRALRAGYDRLLERVDVLLLPTTPITAQPLPAPDAGLAAYLAATGEMFANTCPFDGTHHPALSVPCGEVDGLPVGMMLVGRHFDEARIYRVANAYATRDER